MRRTSTVRSAAAIAAILCAAPAYGDPISAGLTERAARTHLFDHAVTEAQLAEGRGGAADVNINEIVERGVVAENEAHHLTTGSNAISDGAFAGASGLPIVVQNSGNNVLIQNSTILNLNVK
ncbi:MAG: hypothetical protein LJE97_00300 [Betaproteobacteria bacterium]|nr:hypothetical protein [Betaproteobacteria bacterium]